MPLADIRIAIFTGYPYPSKILIPYLYSYLGKISIFLFISGLFENYPFRTVSVFVFLRSRQKLSASFLSLLAIDDSTLDNLRINTHFNCCSLSKKIEKLIAI